MSEQYRYNCVDESVLLPILKKHVFIPLHRWIPYWVPANYLTLVSIVMMWGIFLYFTTVELSSRLEIGAAVLVITAYVIFDHFDGLQAKLTQTSSPLGEWLDHFSDVFNGAIVVYLGFKCLHLPLDGLFLVLAWLNFLAFAATYVEQRIRKELYFGKVGSLEGVVLMILVLVLCISENGRALWHFELGWGQLAISLLEGVRFDLASTTILLLVGLVGWYWLSWNPIPLLMLCNTTMPDGQIVYKDC